MSAAHHLPQVDMAEYGADEVTDMLYCYGLSDRNVSAATRLYAERHPDGRHPATRTFGRIVARYHQTGSVRARPRAGRPATATDEVNATMALAAVNLNPHTSSRALAAELGTSHRSVLTVLHANGFHPYHMHRHQALRIRDFAARVQYCDWLMTKCDDDPGFGANVLWTDEAQFTRDGVVNTHNEHYWSADNPHWLRQVAHQERWRVNVWCGIYNDHVIGPVFYDGTLSGDRYLELILRGTVADLVDNLPLASVRNMWYQLDGAPPHFKMTVRQWLDEAFPQRWIGRAGPVTWPPRSPDLTPLDFYLWGYLKTTVYGTPTTTLVDLQQRIRAACAAIPVETLRTVRRSVQRRAEMCYGADGRHFEHLLD